MRSESPIRSIPKAVVIAASTGGLQALNGVLSNIGNYISATSIFIVLHMPDGFGDIIAKYVGNIAGSPTLLSHHGAKVSPGHIYIATSGNHLQLSAHGRAIHMNHVDLDPVNFCKPAADILFSSAAEVFGPGVLAVVLSGMGVDGLKGCRDIVAHGGQIIVQDRESSVVWGMPGAVAREDLASIIGNPERLGMHIRGRTSLTERSVA